jgi:DNA-binding beta-propeller fold protein YncE
MYRFAALIVLTIGFVLASSSAQQPASDGPYKVLKTAKVGGEGGWDYLYADAGGRRLYIPRRGGAPPAANGGNPAGAAIETRLTIFNLDTLEPVGQIDGVGGNGTAIDPKSGHGFTSSKPVSMFDTKTMKLIKTIEVGDAAPDGIVFDSFNERVYVLSHPTKNATVIDAKDGTVLGTVDLGGTPEEGVADGKGMFYVVMQDMPGSVTAVDVKAMKAVGHYSLNGIGACNGLALDAKNRVLFAACRSDTPPVDPQQPKMVILGADDGKIITTLPLAGGSDGAVFNPATMEAYSTHGNGTLTIIKENSPTSFAVEQNLETMNLARTIAFDSKTNHIFTMADEHEPLPPGAPGGPRARGPAIPGTFTILMIGK